MRRVLAVVGLICWAISGAAQNAPAPEQMKPRVAGTVVRIDLIGDSTQTDNAGYGRI